MSGDPYFRWRPVDGLGCPVGPDNGHERYFVRCLFLVPISRHHAGQIMQEVARILAPVGGLYLFAGNEPYAASFFGHLHFVPTLYGLPKGNAGVSGPKWVPWSIASPYIRNGVAYAECFLRDEVLPGNLRQIALLAAHELGHCLGLPHSDDPRNLMWWIPGVSQGALTDDQAATCRSKVAELAAALPAGWERRRWA